MSERTTPAGAPPVRAPKRKQERSESFTDYYERYVIDDKGCTFKFNRWRMDRRRLEELLHGCQKALGSPSMYHVCTHIHPEWAELDDATMLAEANHEGSKLYEASRSGRTSIVLQPLDGLTSSREKMIFRLMILPKVLPSSVSPEEEAGQPARGRRESTIAAVKSGAQPASQAAVKFSVHLKCESDFREQDSGKLSVAIAVEKGSHHVEPVAKHENHDFKRWAVTGLPDAEPVWSFEDFLNVGKEGYHPRCRMCQPRETVCTHISVALMMTRIRATSS
mmetsp:Transcript_143251/g.249849  ORF Transcript_143251/g.249849 Transcript_143251/m.249849 type:complete len:278 (-) Transcript_143251:24-857(-)